MKFFLQSQQWLQVQKKLGRESYLFDNVLIIKYHLPFGKSYVLIHLDFLPLPTLTLGNPSSGSEDGAEDLIKEIKTRIDFKNVIFIRFNFLKPENNQNKKQLIREGLVEPPIDYYFSATVSPPVIALLSLNPSLKRLLSQMKPKARYNISLAKKKGVQIVHGDFHSFWNLLQETAKRNQIQTHSKEHYQAVLEVFGEKASILTAEYQGQALASILILDYSDTATYLHGGSSETFRNLMPTYLLQWHAIQEAKKRGLSYYDFGGISLEKNHSWEGITRFKLNFGADPIRLLGAYDLILSKFWYRMYILAKGFKRRM